MTFEEAKDLLLARAVELGVDAEVLGSETRELTLGSHEGVLSELTHAKRGGVGVRVVVDGATGYAYSEELTADALAWALDESIENARLQTDEDGFLPPSRAFDRFDLIDEGLSAPLEAKSDAVRGLEAGLRSDPEVSQVAISRYTENETRAVLGSTRGADGSYRNGFAALMASFVARRGDSLKQGFDVELAKEFHALDPATTAETMLHDTTRLLDAEPLATGRYRSWCEPAVVAELLGLLFRSLSGKSLAEGTTRLAGKIGQRVASDVVTIVDDPTLEGGIASRPFDSEGTAAARTVLIEDGVLRSFLHNSGTARKTGQANTGHAARSYKSVLGVGPSNFILVPGAGVAPSDGVILTDIMGLHAGADPVSGDFSLQGFGLRVEGGETRPVDNFAFAGNLFDLLLAVTAVGDTPKLRHMGGGPASGAALVPWIEIEELSFSGS